MCLLIVLRGVDAEYPILVASNRDEARDRKAGPPGLFVGQQQRILSPRDRRAGGTWLGISQSGLFAGITNVAGTATGSLPSSRGELVHLALDATDLGAASQAVAERVTAEAFNPFQLLVADAGGATILFFDGRELQQRAVADSVMVVSNEHRLGELQIPGVAAAAEEGMSVGQRLDALRPLLLDQGERSGHRILKIGGDYGTVSSSLIAFGGKSLIWEYCATSPDQGAYRNYGNLRRRLEG